MRQSNVEPEAAPGSQESPSKPEESIRRKTSDALKRTTGQEFDPTRLSDGSEPTHDAPLNPPYKDPFRDDQSSEDELMPVEEDVSDSSTTTSRGDESQGLEVFNDRIARRLPQRMAVQSSSEATTAMFHADEDILQERLSVDPANLDKEQLVQFVNDLKTMVRNQQSQLDQIKSIEHHELTTNAQRIPHRELVDFTRSLREKIATWADRHFRYEGGIFKSIKQFEHIVSDPDTYIKDEILRTWLIQARLWDLLQYHIFDDDKKGNRKYYGYIWTGGRAKRTWLKDAVTKDNERVDRDMRPLDDVLRPKGIFIPNTFTSLWLIQERN